MSSGNESIEIDGKTINVKSDVNFRYYDETGTYQDMNITDFAVLINDGNKVDLYQDLNVLYEDDIWSANYTTINVSIVSSDTVVKPNSIITGTGSFIPESKVDNEDFLNQEFFDANKDGFPYDNNTIIEKFKKITGIASRRYLKGELNSSDIGTYASERAIEDAGIDIEKIDQIIYAQNFGDIKEGSDQIDMLPCLASRVKFNILRSATEESNSIHSLALA